MPTGQLPFTVTLRAPVQNVAAASDLDTVLGIAPFDGTITSVKYIPKATLTGANTDSRTCSLQNKTTGSLVPATLAFVSAVNATAFTPKTITLGNATNVAILSGDVLSWNSLHVGSTGLADPGGAIEVVLTRS